MPAASNSAAHFRSTLHPPPSTSPLPAPALLAGALVTLAGLAWFYVATFVIVPAYAAQAYGLGVTPYAARFGALGDGFGDVARSLLTRPGLVLRVASEPLRVQYMLKLLAPVGFLALAGPEILLLGLPLLLANLLSGYPFQYSGQLHYSAPLAAYAVFGAIVGSQRIRRLIRRTVAGLRLRRLRRLHLAYVPLVVWLLAWSLVSQIAWGYTPISARFGDSWPAVTAHHRLLDRFLAQIPPDAAVSTTSTLYPHLSHRPDIYRFPALGNSQVVLLDVAAATGWAIHPADVRRQVDELLQSGQWTVQDGADGYLLLRKNAAEVAVEPPQQGVAAFPRISIPSPGLPASRSIRSTSPLPTRKARRSSSWATTCFPTRNGAAPPFDSIGRPSHRCRKARRCACSS